MVMVGPGMVDGTVGGILAGLGGTVVMAAMAVMEVTAVMVVMVVMVAMVATEVTVDGTKNGNLW